MLLKQRLQFHLLMSLLSFMEKSELQAQTTALQTWEEEPSTTPLYI